MPRTTAGVRSGTRYTGASRPGSRVGAGRFGARRLGGGDTGTAWLPGFDPAEMMQSWNDAVSAWQTSWGEMIDRWPSAMPAFPSLTPMGARRRCPRCGCEHCEPCGADDCHCDCCVNDADVVIEARVGERRVVSVIVENDTRRPTEVKAELSAFTTRSANEPETLKGAVFPAAFTLAACDEQVLTIVFESATNIGDRKSAATKEPERIPDVDRCVVYYADLRLEGCPTRPVRIAVALLPRDCDAHRLDCGCGCC